MTITSDQLHAILDRHAKWLRSEPGGAAAPVYGLVGCRSSILEERSRVRPLGVTKYMWNKYQSDFATGQQFWSSEDGDAGELVILPGDDSVDLLAREFPHLPVAGKPVKIGFVHRVSVGSEFFDAPYGRRRGVVWQMSSEPTPFVVHVVDPYTEASNSAVSGSPPRQQPQTPHDAAPTRTEP